jgi:hypothetical protein
MVVAGNDTVSHCAAVPAFTRVSTGVTGAGPALSSGSFGVVSIAVSVANVHCSAPRSKPLLVPVSPRMYRSKLADRAPAVLGSATKIRAVLAASCDGFSAAAGTTSSFAPAAVVVPIRSACWPLTSRYTSFAIPAASAQLIFTLPGSAHATFTSDTAADPAGAACATAGTASPPTTASAAKDLFIMISPSSREAPQVEARVRRPDPRRRLSRFQDCPIGPRCSRSVNQ